MTALNLIEGEARHGPRSAPHVSVASLVLTDFRCHRRLRLNTHAGSVVLSGPNGAGKTTILEALSLLAPGRGLRRARLAELAWREGASAARAWSVGVRLRTALGPMDVATGWQSDEEEPPRERRELKVDGRPVKAQAELAGTFGLVWLTPEMDRLFVEGALFRRRFLDRLVYGIDPAHAGRINAYERAMQQRSALLRRGITDDAWLTALEDRMVTAGTAIAAARREVAALISRACAERPGPFPAARLASEGPIEGWLAEGPALAAEERLRLELARVRRADAETGGAALGPHKSDLAVRHAVTGRLASACSTGEQKTLLIAIILASAALQAAQRGRVPMLLLDEVAAHLDAHHRAALFAAVDALGAQAWYAGTDPQVFAALWGAAQFIALGKSGAESCLAESGGCRPAEECSAAAERKERQFLDG